MAETTTWPGSVLPVVIRTARKQHDCNDCPLPIEPGDRYEVSATPPHRISEYDVDRWLTWRSHHPRHRDGEYLPGCHEAGARQGRTERENIGA
jgi:hypothetical protein